MSTKPGEVQVFPEMRREKAGSKKGKRGKYEEAYVLGDKGSISDEEESASSGKPGVSLSIPYEYRIECTGYRDRTCNAKVQIEAEGEDAKEAVDAIIELSQSKFNINY